MKFSTVCGHKVDERDAFCAECGKPQSKPRPHGVAGNQAGQRNAEQSDRSRHAQWAPALKTEEGRARYRVVEAMHHTKRMWCFSISGLMVLATIGAMFLPSMGFAILPLVLTISFFFLGFSVDWSEAEYFSIPGSKDPAGNHHCIHCGNIGIYRHGEYRTDKEIADCSRCKKNLWTN